MQVVRDICCSAEGGGGKWAEGDLQQRSEHRQYFSPLTGIDQALEKHVKVALRLSADLSTELEWDFAENYLITGHRKKECNLKGKAETFFVTFLERNLIRDYYQNSLGTSVISAPSVRMVQVPEAVSQSGTAFNVMNYAGLVMTLLLFGKSNPAFWVFLSTIQVISYVPLLHCTVPGNLEIFIKEYFGASKASIPFDSLPEWVPNPTSLIKQFVVKPGDSRVLEAGYDSVCFLYNFGPQLFTWVTAGMMYAVFCLMTKLPIQKL